MSAVGGDRPQPPPHESLQVSRDCVSFAKLIFSQSRWAVVLLG